MPESSTTDRFTPEHCTCGTALVENARFCHMCGRPTFEAETAVVTETPAPPQPAPASGLPQRALQLPVSFSNPSAVRAAILMSLAVLLAGMIPGVQLLVPIWWLAAGWCAVLLYRRLTGMALTVRAGARLGSITGILTFVSMLVIMALTILAMGKDFTREIAKQDPQISQIMNDPSALALAIVIALVLIFTLVVGTCAAGGALGARYVGRHGTNNHI